ncbi:cobalt ABC transporter permease CbiQ [Anoxybacillus flavithermus NBRC 109594]|uniref:Cobalt ABC transporter permease CbiQ n=1 Tax=Anoxybacillus flavithermus NBRC 109594 TaxID=1315967 RepID=R4F9X5_9BACL|nr:energy-coupling factor transporter transmembrane component T [Anoxybacillus flavithermus]OAO80399.1 Transmembrane component YkoC [Anoxybacillus flavithermus]GAC90271.1 cobalt ABC transporter permease CbiQ [Anoxybacillus flavithermus NBRC 109594]
MRWSIDHRETWLHQTNPTAKLLFFLPMFVVIVFVHNPNVLINWTIGFTALFMLFSGYRMKHMLLFFVPFLFIFISTSSSMILFGKGETTWFRWGLIHITEESFYRGVHLGFRTLLFAIFGLMFALTTKPVLLFYSLMQQAKVKPKYAYSFLAAIRLLPIMLEEFQTVHQALKVRRAAKAKGFRGKLELVKRYAIPLLSQSIRRAQRIAVAMEAKGFTNERTRTFYYEVTMGKYDIYLLIVICVIVAAGYYVADVFPYVAIKDVR